MCTEKKKIHTEIACKYHIATFPSTYFMWILECYTKWIMNQSSDIEHGSSSM